MKRRLLGTTSTLLGTIFSLVSNLTNAAVLPLESRLGGSAYYDPNLDITWAADADINGIDTWDNHMAWAADLTIDGIADWRLPSADVNGDGIVIDCFGGGVAGCLDNEMGYLFWEEGINATSTPGPFSNVRWEYWYGTEVDPDSARSFTFRFGFEGYSDNNKDNFPSNAWAVHDGDVVPIPAAVWLFGSGLVGLLGVAKRKH